MDLIWDIFWWMAEWWVDRPLLPPVILYHDVDFVHIRSLNAIAMRDRYSDGAMEMSFVELPQICVDADNVSVCDDYVKV